MGFAIKGYVLEKPRLGQANSPYTSSPNNGVLTATDQTAYNLAYPSAETNPPTYYMVVVEDDPTEGLLPQGPLDPPDPSRGRLPFAKFGWTKNEGPLTRFDYSGRAQRFKLLSGSAPDEVGVIAPNINQDAKRLKVARPISDDPIAYPFRLSVGDLPGTTFTMTIVTAFGSPLAGTAEMRESDGKLNWNPGDLPTHNGQAVRFQRQNPYQPNESTGKLGLVEDMLLLSPIPATTQHPVVRIGFGKPLIDIEVPNDAGLTDPSSGQFKWSLATGKIRLSSVDVAAHPGHAVYYDGILLGSGVSLTTTTHGTVTSPTAFGTIPVEGGDVIFRVYDPSVSPNTAVQMSSTVFVDTFNTTGVQGQVQIRRSDGHILFSLADQNSYGTWNVKATVCDLLIDHGVSMRFYRATVDPTATDPTVRDVSIYYNVTGSTFADPIIASPQVFLPAIPVDSMPITVQVVQGTGTYVDNNFQDLAGPTYPVVDGTLGYVIDYEQGLLRYANRRHEVILDRLVASGAMQLPDPLEVEPTVTVAIENSPGSGTWTNLVFGSSALLDANSGSVSFTSTAGNLVVSGSSGTVTGNHLSDPTADFSGVGVGYIVIVSAGDAAVLGVYRVNSLDTPDVVLDMTVPGGPYTGLTYGIYDGEEILADRYMSEVLITDARTKVERVTSLGTITNSPRFTIPVDQISKSRFRFGKTRFSTSVVSVSSFSSPASGVVQVLDTTGELNFSTADVTEGFTVYWVHELQQQVDYKMSPALGLIEFTDRLMELEEVLVTYASLDESTYVNGEPVYVTERAVFLVRKELTADHPDPTSTLSFNPLGREVASDPAPAIFRGGRPQVIGTQVNVDTTSSTMTFMPDDLVTDALPHGAIIGPEENVYVDYYIYEAMGGEKNLTVQHPAMQVPSVSIPDAVMGHVNYPTQPLDRFQVVGDWRASFPVNYLMQVDDDLYLLGTPTYDSGTGLTDIVLASPQKFQNGATNPVLQVSSGPTLVTSLFPFISVYYVVQSGGYDTIARGMNKFSLPGDVSHLYRTGTVVLFSHTSTVLDFYRVTGVAYNARTGKTDITLSANARRQYKSGTHVLKRSVRPVLTASANVAQTFRVPILTNPYEVYRRITGQAGRVISQPLDYKIDDSGKVEFASGLQPNEAFSILYTGHETIAAGRRAKVSYTCIIAPDTNNGLLNQTLMADFTTASPDTFFFRVESLTNFRSELAQQYQKAAKASIPSGGPILSNTSKGKLYDQGVASLYFAEGHYANEDVAARSSLQFYNEAVNYLEDVLQDMDGRIVGDADGRFLFDGSTGTQRTTWSTVANQIDDTFKVSDAPYVISFVGGVFSVTPIGTWVAAWTASPMSRFFPTWRRRYGVSASGAVTGDPIMDLGQKNLLLVSNLRSRLAWAQITQPANIGDVTLYVDNALGSATSARPAFEVGQAVVIQNSDGSYVIAPSAYSGGVPTPPITTIASIALDGKSVTLDTALTIAAPGGATLYRSPTDQYGFDPEDLSKKLITYKYGFDFGWNSDSGQLTYVKPYPPFDGSVSAIPGSILAVLVRCTPVVAGVPLSCEITFSNSATAPDRFPALDGGTTDDDGEVRLPLQQPWPGCEKSASSTGGLGTTLTYLQSGTGVLRAATQDPYIGTGNLDVAKTTITLASGTFPAPVPAAWDLVRITSGLNGVTSWHRISSVGASSVTVDRAFSFQDTGFTFAVTVSNTISSGAGTFTSPSGYLDDAGAAFDPTVELRGYTAVVTSGAQAGQRRQIVQVVSPTRLLVSPTLAAGAGNYRVVRSTPTFGNVAGSLMNTLEAATQTSIDVLVNNIPPNPWAERAALEHLFDLVFTDLATGTTGSTTMGSPTFSDPSASFDSTMTGPDHYVYVRNGAVAGIYAMVSVESPTSMTVNPAFGATVVGTVTYRVVKAFGLSRKSLTDLFGVMTSIDAFVASSTTFLNLLQTLVPVVLPTGFTDPNSFATAVVGSDLDSRWSVVDARATALVTTITLIENVLKAADKLYDRRYTWINARINLENGTLHLQMQAVLNRIKAQLDATMQLTKMLAVL